MNAAPLTPASAAAPATPTLPPPPVPPASRAATDVPFTELPEADTRAPIRLGLWVLVAGFAGFVLWAGLAPLDQGVVAPAVVSTEVRRHNIQHFSGGVIRHLAVVEGQSVRAGDLLVELEESATRAGFESVRQTYLAQRAQESRLLAEAAEAPRIDFHPDLLQPGDAVAVQLMAAQQQLFTARRAAASAEQQALQETIGGLRSQLQGLEQVRASRQQQREFALTQLENVRALAEQGYAPRSQVLQIEQQLAELRSALADNEAQGQRVRAGIAELQLRSAQRRQEVLKEVSGQLADVRRDVQANQERLAALGGELRRMRIVAPQDGQVVGLAVGGPGGVVGPGQSIMNIVPQGAGLLFDARVPPSMIDRVAVGDSTELRFSTFTDAPTLVVEGRVVALSADAVTEQIGPMVNTFYLARVELTEQGRRALGDRQLHPGMPAEVLIKGGERTVLGYLLHPLTKRIAGAMKEQ